MIESHQEQAQLHREAVAAVKRPIIWEQLLRRIDTVVSVQNLMGHSETANLSILQLSLRIAPDKMGFSITTRSFPMATVSAQFESKRIVRIDSTYQKSDLADTFRWVEYLEFFVDTGDNVLLRHKGEPVTVDQATSFILEPVRRNPGFTVPNRAQAE